MALSIKYDGDFEGAARWLPEAKRLLYLLKAGNFNELDCVWDKRHLQDGSFVEVSKIFDNDFITITTPFKKVEELEAYVFGLFANDFGYRHIGGIGYPVNYPSSLLGRGIVIDEGKFLGDYTAFQNNDNITFGGGGPSQYFYGISCYNNKVYASDWKHTYGVIWQFNTTCGLESGVSLYPAHNLGGIALFDLEVNQDRMATTIQAGYYAHETFVYDLAGNQIYTIIPPVGYTAYAFVIYNSTIIVLWYGFGLDVIISRYQLSDGVFINQFPVPLGTQYAVNMTVNHSNNLLYVLVSGHTGSTNETSLHSVLEFNLTSTDLINTIDLLTKVPVGEFANVLYNNGMVASFFQCFDIATTQDAIYISGNNTVGNDNIVDDFYFNYKQSIYYTRLKSGVYKFDMDMNFVQNLDSKPITKQSWIEPISIAINYPSNVSGDKYIWA